MTATFSDTVATTQTFGYNRQGLMASVITETTGSSIASENGLKRVDYSYDSAGNRVGSAKFQANTQ
ncbi:MAG: hypothetical protein KF752_03910 [Pirellulaceae bacterium]|nr:hypothetical protein [Pirellulaceae bacterium]